MRYFFSFLPVFLITVNVFAQFQIKEAFPGLAFTRPIDLQHAGDGSDRIFVVEQAGFIHVFSNDSLAARTEIFLDIEGRVDDSGNEMGLLGLAFHPDYASNGHFYVNYTASGPRRTVIARYTVSGSDPDSANPASEHILLEYNQPETNHNGGQMAFGPDGFLYIASGDGGGGGDQHGEIGNGQDRTNLLGKILRIDVDRTDPQLNYAIPEANPFYGNPDGYRAEIFAYGLRNPWRFSFDKETGMLWTGDVGQNEYEEINIIENGKNYGWRIMEGSHCFNPQVGCQTEGLELPVWEYDHSVGYSITGGYVYRGENVPELQGKYIYGDYVTRQIWALSYDGINPAQNETVAEIAHNLVSFGTDESDELYMLTFNGSNSKIYTFRPTVTAAIESGKSQPISKFTLGENYPDPFNPQTNIPFTLEQSGRADIRVYDISGRHIRTILSAQKPAGAHIIQWDGRNKRGAEQPSGIYLYQMRLNGNLIDTKQMVLLK